MAAVVLDSSVALSWCLPDEETFQPTDLQTLIARDGAVVASHWPLEVVNALIMASRRGRIDSDFRSDCLRDLASLPIELDHETSARAWDDTLEIAEAHSLTLYDAAYLELAVRRALPLASLDQDLVTAAGKLGVAIL